MSLDIDFCVHYLGIVCPKNAGRHCMRRVIDTVEVSIMSSSFSALIASMILLVCLVVRDVQHVH